MAIYHLEVKAISRGNGRSAVAASAYMSCSRILNDYDGVQHDYTRKGGLVWQNVFLPEFAPREWQDRSILWNAVEENERTKDSRLAREFVVALPIELDHGQWQQLLTEFIQEQFVSAGMCADAAIHDTDGHNPHAHILLTVRPLDEQGSWQYKTEKEYLCVKDGEERGFTAAEFKAAQADGWEKQYQYKVGKKKVYMAPSAAEAQGLERVSKYPKSTKYGRQNPISERWNSEEQLLLWREAWAEINNRYLEQAGYEERIDHRSHAERGLDEQPTVHEGVSARAMERQGILADRCELNRQIKADNALIRSLKKAVKELMAAVRNSLPAAAEVLESLRQTMLIHCYHKEHSRIRRKTIADAADYYRRKLRDYFGIVSRIKEKAKERKKIQAEKQALPIWKIQNNRDLTARISALTEELEELQTERTMLLASLRCKDASQISAVKQKLHNAEKELASIDRRSDLLRQQLESTVSQYKAMKSDAELRFDPMELYKARQAIRKDKESAAADQMRMEYSEEYSGLTMLDSRLLTNRLIGEDAEERKLAALIRDQEKQTTKIECSDQEDQER